jgi:hypothetical protein
MTGGGTTGGGASTSGTCDDPTGYYCADFESFKSSGYLSLSKEQLKMLPVGDPRSGGVALTNYLAVAFASNASFVNEDGIFSFWVRFPTIADQPFISFGRKDAPLIWFGVEHSRFKWWAASNPPVVAPSDESQAYPAEIDVWTCVEVERYSKPRPTLRASLTMLDGTTVDIVPIDDEATTGIDDDLVNAGAATNDWNGVIKLGTTGTNIEIDDFMFAPSSVPSTCDAYVATLATTK